MKQGGMRVVKNKQYVNDSEEANQMMGEKFKDYNPRNISAADSEVESTNQKIQKQFYENEGEDYLLPFHLDINSDINKASGGEAFNIMMKETIGEGPTLLASGS